MLTRKKSQSMRDYFIAVCRSANAKNGSASSLSKERRPRWVSAAVRQCKTLWLINTDFSGLPRVPHPRFLRDLAPSMCFLVFFRRLSTGSSQTICEECKKWIRFQDADFKSTRFQTRISQGAQDGRVQQRDNERHHRINAMQWLWTFQAHEALQISKCSQTM